jgi:mono/diheme cytochrome c family protein
MKKTPALSILILAFALTAACGSGSAPVAEPPASAPTAEAVAQPTEVPPPVEPASPTEETAEEEISSGQVSFSNNIMPIFENRCIDCHGGRRTREGLDMKTYESLMNGSNNGPVVAPGDADASLLVELIVSGDMPNRGPKVTPAELQLIIEWVNQGALNN